LPEQAAAPREEGARRHRLDARSLLREGLRVRDDDRRAAPRRRARRRSTRRADARRRRCSMTPLTCRELADFLGDYFAGELGRAERATFERHLTDCRDCTAYLRSYEATIQLARAAHTDEPVPASVPDGLVRAILRARKRPRRRRS